MNRIKKLIILSLIAIAFVLLGGKNVNIHADTKSYSMSFIGNEPVTGTVGENLTEQEYIIKFNGDLTLVNTIPEGTDISDWFFGSTTPLPAGLQVVLKEDADVGAKSMKVVFKGLLYGASKDNISMRARNYFFDVNESDYYAWAEVRLSGENAKFNIVRNFSAPSGYTAVAQAMYFKDENSSDPGWKLKGKKDEGLSGTTELNVVIKGNFIVGLSKNTDITNWFTGHLFKINTLLNTSVNSQLPPGVSAKLKNAVNVGDNSFTIVFYGIPTRGSRDLIAFTIPSGYVTYDPNNSAYKGDLRSGLKTTNISGKYAYDIESTDGDYKSVYVRITYPDRDIQAGEVFTEEDGLIATYDLIGTDASGNQIKFKGINVGTDPTSCTVQYLNGAQQGEYSAQIKSRTGLTPKVKSISADGTHIEVIMTGTVRKCSGYPYTLGGSGWQLLSSYTTLGQYVDGIVSEDTNLRIIEPDPEISMSKSVRMTSTPLDAKAVVDNPEIVINLGKDSLAVNLTKGTKLDVFPYKTTENSRYVWRTGDSSWLPVYATNFSLELTKAASVGDTKLYVKVNPGTPQSDYTAFISLAFPKAYLTRASAYGLQDIYYFKEGSVYQDVKKYVDYYASVSDLTITGSVTKTMQPIKILHEDGTVTTSQALTPSGIGKGKLYFTVTTMKNIHVDKDYEAGAVVNDLIKFNRSTNYLPKLVDPFYHKDYCSVEGSYYTIDENLYKIRTVDAISKDPDGVSSAHTFNLMLDLKETVALSPSTSKTELMIYDSTSNKFQRVYAPGTFKFNIAPEGEVPFDESVDYGSSGPGTIDYSSGEDIILYATDKDGKEVTTTYINLSQEKLVTDLNYKYYSLDGGTKWKETKAAFTDKQFSGFLNKGMTLMIADSYDKKEKKPADNAVVLSFSKINARPKAVKYKVDYVTYADPSGVTAGQWMIADSSLNPLSAEDLQKIEIGVTGSDKKKVSEEGYGSWPASGGLAIAPFEGKKATVTNYYVRVKATSDTPSSKPVKISVKGQQKAPKEKVDYKKEVIKLKKGEIIFFGDALSGSMTALSENADSYEDYEGKIIAAGDSAKVVDISPYLTGTRNTVIIWSAASAKGPASSQQIIKLAARAPITEVNLKPSGGKLKLDKKYEVYDPESGKWGGIPKISAAGEYEYKIRIKATAKGGKESDTTYAAGVSATLKITYGEYDTTKHKSGITAASIVIGNISESGTGEGTGSDT